MDIASIFLCLAACFFYCSFAFRSPFGKSPFLAGAKRSDFSLAYKSSFPDLSPNGENYLQFAKTPEALFFRYDIDHNFTQAESHTDGLVYPIMALHPNAIKGEELVPQAYGIESGWYMDSTLYIIPKDTPIPETMALLQDKRAVPRWDFGEYYLVTREPCTPEVHQRNVFDFVSFNGSRPCFEEVWLDFDSLDKESQYDDEDETAALAVEDSE